MEDRLVNLGQLALALQLPRDWLKDEALADRIPCLHIGKKLRFNLGAVEQALALRAGGGAGAGAPLVVKNQGGTPMKTNPSSLDQLLQDAADEAAEQYVRDWLMALLRSAEQAVSDTPVTLPASHNDHHREVRT
jgi:hypothetical protein